MIDWGHGLRTEIKKKLHESVAFFVDEGELESEKFVKLERGFFGRDGWFLIWGARPLKFSGHGLQNRASVLWGFAFFDEEEEFGEDAAQEGFPEGGYYYDAGEDPGGVDLGVLPWGEFVFEFELDDFFALSGCDGVIFYGVVD